ncbi:T9SS type A sorting domain-containing protein, partial [Pedobacter sp.]
SNITVENIYIGQNYDVINQSNLSAAHTSDITDLSALYNITQITGDLVIENNLRLTNINGLMNLVEIGGKNLKIKRNSLLTYCNNIAIKNYLAKSATTFKREITGNLQNCLNEAAVKNANNNTCPSGSFNFTTQKQIDDFGGLYSNCQTYSITDMTINGVDIKDLRPLQKIKSLTGNLIIQNNTILETLTGLENLTAVNGYISVATNAKLKDISALKNISASSIEKLDVGLNIQGNPVLNVCNLPNFCAYLSNPSNPKTISGNAAVCVNEQAFLNTCNTLPASLLSYNATATNTTVKLQWQTSFELNNKKFEIYRSGDDQQFIKIGEIKGLNTKGNYLFSDQQPLNGNNYYKLMQLDTDGKESNLGLRYINFSVVKKHIQVFPNPTTNKVTISFRPNVYQVLQLFDLNGKTISTIQIHKQDNQKEISLENYPAGVYLLKLIGNDGSETMKVAKNP